MTRHPRRPHPSALPIHGLALALLVLVLSARVALAAAPTFQGTITSPDLCSPRGIALTPAGYIMVGSDCLSPHMNRYNPAGALSVTWTFAPGYQGSPNGVAIDAAGNLFVTDYNANRVQKYDLFGIQLGEWPTAVGPTDVAVNEAGEVYIACLGGHTVARYRNDGVYLATIGGTGLAAGQYQEPSGIAVDAAGRVYVADAGRGRVIRYRPDGSFDLEFATPAVPYDVAEGPDGNVYVITAAANWVHQYSPAGALLGSFQSPLGMSLEFRIAISPTGMIYITDQYKVNISKFQIDLTTPTVRSSFGRIKSLYR